MEKNGKWNDEAEAFWREHIRSQEYTEIYNPFAVLTGNTDSAADGKTDSIEDGKTDSAVDGKTDSAVDSKL